MRALRWLIAVLLFLGAAGIIIGIILFFKEPSPPVIPRCGETAFCPSELQPPKSVNATFR
jgi:hypothetical protein